MTDPQDEWSAYLSPLPYLEAFNALLLWHQERDWRERYQKSSRFRD